MSNLKIDKRNENFNKLHSSIITKRSSVNSDSPLNNNIHTNEKSNSIIQLKEKHSLPPLKEIFKKV